MRRVTVVGGGLAGIAAALECADRGAGVTLHEARAWLGGATFSIEREGLRLDNGQHVFLRCYTEYIGLLRRLGVESKVVLQDRLSIPVLAPDGRRAWIRRSGLPAPLHLAGTIARYRFLSRGDRVRVLRAVRALSRLDLDDPALDRRTFADWLVENGQSQASVAALWDLITLPTVNLPAAEASLALAAKVFRTGLIDTNDAADVGYAAVPLRELHGEAGATALAAAGIDLRLRSRVDSLTDLGPDTVVLAVPHEDAPALLPPGAVAADVRALGASPIVNLHVVFDRRVTDLPFSAGVGTPVQFVFDRTESSGLGSGQCLAVSLSGATVYRDRSVDDLRAEFVPALAELFPAARSAHVERFLVTREPRATFRGVPGTRALRPGPVTRVPGLYLAGAWTDTGWPATMEGAVRSGLAAARAALAGTPAREPVAA